MFDDARERSTTVALVRTVRDSLREAAGRSRVMNTVGDVGGSRARERSRVTDSIRTLGIAMAGSVLGRLLEGVRSRVDGIHRRSRSVQFGTRLRRYLESSFGYRWLTAEPNPDVVVIDLRDTWTVGPGIAALERSIPKATAASPASVVASTAGTIGSIARHRPIALASALAFPAIGGSLGTLTVDGSLTLPLLVVHVTLTAFAAFGCRSRRSLEEVLDSQIGNWVTAAFEPPEPPTPAEGRVENESEKTNDNDRPNDSSILDEWPGIEHMTDYQLDGEDSSDDQ